jgi:hypothetical protein
MLTLDIAKFHVCVSTQTFEKIAGNVYTQQPLLDKLGQTSDSIIWAKRVVYTRYISGDYFVLVHLTPCC